MKEKDVLIRECAAGAPARVSLTALPLLLLKATRPRQWAKNLLVFLAFFFTLGTHQGGDLQAELSVFVRSGLAFIVFCLISGATYIINDLLDAERDRQHPRKRLRPIASGRLSVVVARAGALALIGFSTAAAFVLDRNFALVLVLYLALNVAYSTTIKNQVILDVFSISAGFVLRAVAGALVIDVPVSPWLFVMTSLGALMIALGKRRSELASLGEGSGAHRGVLQQYTIPFVDQMITVVAPAAVVSYTLYTFTAPNLPDNHAMMLTVPFVVYGIFRYLFLVRNSDLGGAPEELFLTDGPLLVNNVLWLVAASSVLLLFK